MLSFSSTSTPKSFSGLLLSHSAQSVLVFGSAPPHMQDLALGLVELHAVHEGSHAAQPACNVLAGFLCL